MNISSAIFDRSAPDLSACPDESLPEFAFIGRSNVGKSSLLNMLAGKDGLARVSPVPGFTKMINFFTMNGTWRLVDLPGYGFAQVAREDKSKFNKAVAEYLVNRENLLCVFSLIDSELPPQPIDLEFLEWLVSNSVPLVLVFTKADKTRPDVVQANIEALKARLSNWCENLPLIFTCSAKTGQGRKQLLDLIGEAIAEYNEQLPDKAAEHQEDETPLIEDPPGTPWTIAAHRSDRKNPKSKRPW